MPFSWAFNICGPLPVRRGPGRKTRIMHRDPGAASGWATHIVTHPCPSTA
ncbi:hypothetical protein SCANM63S_02371 [Streptomyces canarius]